MSASDEYKFLEEFDERFLVCSICSERYKKAKCLPCLHNFCTDCLDTLIQTTGKLCCPNCRRSHTIPQDGVNGLSNHEMVEYVKERDAKSVKSNLCGGCEKNKSVKHCIECGFDICDDCAMVHGKFPSTRSHHVIPLDEYRSKQSKDPASVQPPVHCDKHPIHPVTFYCDTCDGPICLECTALEHPRPEHKYRYLNDAASEYKKELTVMVSKIDEKSRETTGTKSAVQKVSKSLDRNFQSEEKKVKQHADKIVKEVTQKIRDNEQQLLKEMKAVYAGRKENLNAQVKELQNTEDDLLHARDFADKLMHYGNATQLMSAKKGMTYQIQELLTNQTQCEPTEDDYLEFQSVEDFCKAKTLGTILTSSDNFQITETPKYPRVGEEIHVNMTNNKDNTGRHDIKEDDIATTLTVNKNEKQDVKVTDNKDGTFSLTSQAKTEGEHELSVSVRKKTVMGSPVRMKVIPKSGLVCKFGGKGSGNAQLNSPHGVIMTKLKKGIRNLFVCDYGNRRLQSFTINGNHKQVLQVSDSKSGNTYTPHKVTQSVDGNIFFTNASRLVIVCDENGKFVRCFGENELLGGRGIAVSPTNGRVYVADYSSHCVRIYSQDGHYFNSFGSKGNGKGQLNSPWGLDINSLGNVLVSEYHNNRVQAFNEDGQHLFFIGDTDDKVSNPSGVVTDKDDNVYVCNYTYPGKVHKFDSHGKFIARIDSDLDGLIYLIGVYVTDDEPFGKVVVVDCWNNCIKVFTQ
ncbi:tripartite motif-containing protein 2-like [Glandiceps talaboti]